ncbi:MAG: indolepyruvate oxidoreductase subunit beta [bacterium]|nr:indolepyruvate oxidoreductase subunit beta [bacterium]
MTRRPSSDREPFRLLLTGVGGQGILTIARSIGDAALTAGREVVVGQLHGMSQRGGSVEATVIIGPGRSSFIADGAADAVLALEPLEALRARPKMSAATRVVVNLGRVIPFTLAQQGREYPDLAWILAEIRAVAPELITVDGPALVQAAGAARSLNIVMLGALAGLEILPLAGDTLWQAIAGRLPAGHLETNRRAFAGGREAVRIRASSSEG